MTKESRLKFAFRQDIYREADDKLILKATITGTALNQRGRPEIPEELDAALERNAAMITG
jgi:acyl-CoA thioester hydrolase